MNVVELYGDTEGFEHESSWKLKMQTNVAVLETLCCACDFHATPLEFIGMCAHQLIAMNLENVLKDFAADVSDKIVWLKRSVVVNEDKDTSTFNASSILTMLRSAYSRVATLLSMLKLSSSSYYALQTKLLLRQIRLDLETTCNCPISKSRGSLNQVNNSTNGINAILADTKPANEPPQAMSAFANSKLDRAMEAAKQELAPAIESLINKLIIEPEPAREPTGKLEQPRADENADAPDNGLPTALEFEVGIIRPTLDFAPQHASAATATAKSSSVNEGSAQALFATTADNRGVNAWITSEHQSSQQAGPNKPAAATQFEYEAIFRPTLDFTPELAADYPPPREMEWHEPPFTTDKDEGKTSLTMSGPSPQNPVAPHAAVETAPNCKNAPTMTTEYDGAAISRSDLRFTPELNLHDGEKNGALKSINWVPSVLETPKAPNTVVCHRLPICPLADGGTENQSQEKADDGSLTSSAGSIPAISNPAVWTNWTSFIFKNSSDGSVAPESRSALPRSDARPGTMQPPPLAGSWTTQVSSWI